MKTYQGLTQEEAQKRLIEYGPNSIEQKKKNVILETIVEQAKSPLVVMLVLAAIVSYALGEHIESIAIFVVVLINLFFTLFQVYKADNAVAALSAMISNRSVVTRGAAHADIDSKHIVVGDIVFLESGNRVPADMKILESTYTMVDEAVLTGESMPVEKKNMEGDSGLLFMGTSIRTGELYAEVVSTGRKTKFGEIAETMRGVEEKETNLQKKLNKLTKVLGVIGLVGAGIVLALSFMQDKGLFESMLLTISLAVAVVPEGLPAVMTAIMSIGVGAMAKQGVVMRRLDAIEGMGDVTVLATDKTGTLTQNKMTVETLWQRDIKEKTSLSANDALFLCMGVNVEVHKVSAIDGSFSYTGDPTETAIKVFSDEYYIKNNLKSLNINILERTPFSSDTRVRKTRIDIDDKEYELINGAPETVLELDTSLDNQEKLFIQNELQKQASKGLRTLAFAFRSGEDIKFLAFVALKDPLRPGIRESIDEAMSMGIRTVLITGDNPLTAEAIAIEAGITTKKSNFLTGDMIAGMSDVELTEALKNIEVFARIAPDQKLRLVRLLQESGEVVAMTGDGVNDAPALKQADVGIAMGKVGTDVAKEAADAVVTDDNYVTIVLGVREGRMIIRRIELAAMFFIAGNMGELLYIVLSMAFGLPVLTPLQILYINIITDAIPALALSFAPVHILSKKVSKKGLLGRHEYTYIAISASLVALLSVYASWLYRETPVQARGVVFLLIIFMQQIMLIDVWLGLVRKMHDFKKLLHTSVLFAVGSMAITLMATYSIPFTRVYFDIANINLSSLVIIPYGFLAYCVYVYIRIIKKRKII